MYLFESQLVLIFLFQSLHCHGCLHWQDVCLQVHPVKCAVLILFLQELSPGKWQMTDPYYWHALADFDLALLG